MRLDGMARLAPSFREAMPLRCVACAEF
jgi:hypothetical protein